MRLIGLVVALALGQLLLPLRAHGQPAGKVFVLGFLFSQSSAAGRDQDEAFRKGMDELGYVEGRHYTVERRYAEGSSELLPRLASELVRLKVDVIVAPSSSAALAVQRATSQIPIVFAFANDPVGLGLVASLSRPGSNATGLTPISADLSAKRLELFKEAVPEISRIAVLSLSTYPVHARQAMVNELVTAARLLRVDIRVVELTGREDLDAAFVKMVKERVGAVTALPLPFLTGQRQRIAELALRSRLPSVFHWREYVESGGLMSYGANQDDLIRRAAKHVDKILKGAKPADLPVEQPTVFELVINMKTAKTLGLTIPQTLLLRADQVIE
jgi:putative ABC transport system substrate-binding protein